VVTLIALTSPLSYKNKINSSSYYFFILAFVFISFFRFSVNSVLWFYLFFEASLIPTFFLITGWGYQIERVSSVFYFLLYTVFASLPFLLFVASLNAESLNYFRLTRVRFTYFSLLEVFAIRIITTMAFLVKAPIYLFHL
jgi:NADH-quinone oxidoreductase subunit M